MMSRVIRPSGAAIRPLARGITKRFVVRADGYKLPVECFGSISAPSSTDYE